MRIAQIAPLHVAVPPRNYGGTERVIANLVEALVQLGHDVTLFASGDSRTSAELIPCAPRAFKFDPAVDVCAYHVAMLSDIYRQADRFDVLHSHLDYLTLPFTRWTTIPTVLTLHGRLDLPQEQRALRAFPEANYVSISKSQQSSIPHLNWVGTVYHSVDVASFPFTSTPGDYLAFVGRISPEKGPEHAIAIAKKAGIPLKIAAKVDPVEQRYYDEVIKPLLDDPLIEYLGPVGEQRKRTLLANARALLLPIRWDEPFGMVFIEALACGTPVLTCPRGSVPELLRDGVTGYASGEDDELVQAARRVHAISREGCRAYARRYFDIHRLALEYVNIYCRVRQRKTFFSLPTIEAETAGIGEAGIAGDVAADATAPADAPDVATWMAPTRPAAEIARDPMPGELDVDRGVDRARDRAREGEQRPRREPYEAHGRT
jgi:glycosyltransferase involved in cell wall biosynthesis